MKIIQIKPRRNRRSPEQIAQLVREFGSSGFTQWQFCENLGDRAEGVAAEPENRSAREQQTQADGSGS